MQVLLGESYYAECSAKQTVDILDRRGKLLNSRIEDVQSQLDDLNVESRFFNETLADAAVSIMLPLSSLWKFLAIFCLHTVLSS
jgi:unconventional prefoldin RPB5 interactor 1